MSCGTVPGSDSECRTVLDSGSECGTVLYSASEHGMYSMPLKSAITSCDVTKTNYDKFLNLLMLFEILQRFYCELAVVWLQDHNCIVVVNPTGILL